MARIFVTVRREEDGCDEGENSLQLNVIGISIYELLGVLKSVEQLAARKFNDAWAQGPLSMCAEDGATIGAEAPEKEVKDGD